MVVSFSNRDDSKRNLMVKFIDVVINDIVVSRKIEKGIYNYVIGVAKDKNIQRSWDNTMFINLYNSKILSVYSNIDKNSYIKNTKLVENIKSGNIDPEKVGFLSVYDTFPDNWKELLNIKSKRDKIKYELKPEAMTNLFKCRKCGSRETSYYEVQTRSADEPMTQFITCLSCSNRWKQ
jgi:DNA-directed RNA polymerase subunit M/transcription elongation factor TFIIS|tara:strand:+ start:3837 stop:4370 length:534 start_codon:yes stop_codon:yes gene_type:complete